MRVAVLLRPKLEHADDGATDADRDAKGPTHEAVHTLLQVADIMLDVLEAFIDLFEALVNLSEALIHVGLHGLEAFIHQREAFAHQLALVFQLFLDADHAFAQLDLVQRWWLAEALFGQPVADVYFDELDIFLG